MPLLLLPVVEGEGEMEGVRWDVRVTGGDLVEVGDCVSLRGVEEEEMLPPPPPPPPPLTLVNVEKSRAVLVGVVEGTAEVVGKTGEEVGANWVGVVEWVGPPLKGVSVPPGEPVGTIEGDNEREGEVEVVEERDGVTVEVPPP